MSQHFQHYTLTSTLEQHAASTTYLAVQDQRPTRSMVLKVFHDSGFRNAAEQEKFLEETEKFSLLSNPLMVPIIEAGIEGEQAYIVSEYMPNGSLRVRLDRAYPQRLPLQQAMMIITQIGQGLAYLHARYMIHGQLKPEHILFTSNGRALVSDPYCATKPAPWDAENENARDAYRYLAPEQFAGKSSPLSDQYALCCVAYELLTGRPPFTSRDPQTLKEQQLRSLPSPISPILPDLPATIEQAILKGLAKEPSQRHTDSIAFLAALQSSKTATAPDLPLPRAMRRTRSLTPSISIVPPMPPTPAKKPVESTERHILPHTAPPDEGASRPQLNTTPNPTTPIPAHNVPRYSRPQMTTPLPAINQDYQAPLKNVADSTETAPSANPVASQPLNTIPTIMTPRAHPQANRRSHITAPAAALTPDVSQPLEDIPATPPASEPASTKETFDASPRPNLRQSLEDVSTTPTALEQTSSAEIFDATIRPNRHQPFEDVSTTQTAAEPAPTEETFDEFLQELALEDLLRMLEQPARDSNPTAPFHTQPPVAETFTQPVYPLDTVQMRDNQPATNTAWSTEDTHSEDTHSEDTHSEDTNSEDTHAKSSHSNATLDDLLQELALEDALRLVDKNVAPEPPIIPTSDSLRAASAPLPVIVPKTNSLPATPAQAPAPQAHSLSPALHSLRKWGLFSRKTTIWTLALLLMIGSLVTYTALAATSPKSSSLIFFNNLIHPTPKATVDQLGILPTGNATSSTPATTKPAQVTGAPTNPTPTATPETTLLYSNTVSTQAPTADVMVLAFVPALTVTDTRIEADITIHGNTGGILFRNSSKAGYSMRISTNGTYDLENATRSLTSGHSSAIKKGDNVSNHLTIIARGTQITISINGKEVINLKDSSASSGNVGILALNSGKSTTTNCALNIYTN